MLPGDEIHTLRPLFAELEARGTTDFAAEELHTQANQSIDVRYRGQGYELNVPYDPESAASAVEAFHQLHRKRYGFSDSKKLVEIVNLRLRMVAKAELYTPLQSELIPGDGSAARFGERSIYFDGKITSSKCYRREALLPGDEMHGPAMITEYTSATVLPPGCRARVDGFRNLVITVAEEAGA
jgi:N-methylhydantoinase A